MNRFDAEKSRSRLGQLKVQPIFSSAQIRIYQWLILVFVRNLVERPDQQSTTAVKNSYHDLC